MDERSPLTTLKGIGEKKAEIFKKAGIRDIGSLITYYPRAYESYEEPNTIHNSSDGQILAVFGFIQKPLSVIYGGGMQITSGIIRTQTEEVHVTWYRMPYLRSSVRPGVSYIFRGRVKEKGRYKYLQQPQIFTPDDYREKMAALQPVYRLSTGLTRSMIRSAVEQALSGLDLSVESIPEDIRKKYQLSSVSFAIRQIHFPDDEHALRMARKRLVFDEFLVFILGLRALKENRKREIHSYQLEKTGLTDRMIHALPYELTNAQKRVWDQIETDLTRPQVMARLVQGDVGSGKTVIAFLALLLCAGNGYQSALMAPTEVLARQHFEAFGRITGQMGIRMNAVLLTGSMSAKEKREICRRIETGEAKIIMGTHALFQEKVTYQNLALVITDEQHRFGVRQREQLAFKGELPHMLVMSATPIPRTLAVILYGELDVSVIDEVPASRKPVKNCVVSTAWRPNAYSFLEKEVKNGHQVYVICPMVEESDVLEAENVTDYTETLRKNLSPDIRVDYLHGRMRGPQKDDIMSRFARNEIQVLVSTTVVEVGVNVPNATVMMVENAERFGLAQLHQLRGRVGRGDAQSYCILISASDQDHVRERLDILNHSNDGFEIAQKDLEMRGPGDLFGIRQSGLISFAIGDVFQDADILQNANEAVQQILEEDARLEKEKHAVLKKKLQAFLGEDMQSFNI